MKTIFQSVIFLLLISIMGCNVYKNVYSYSDKEIVFKNYKTFAWLPDSSGISKNDSLMNTANDMAIITNNAKSYIINYLGERGYKITKDNPDLLIQLVFEHKQKERMIPSPVCYSYPYYYNNPYYFQYNDYYTFYGWGNHYVYCDNTARYKEIYINGTITVNMFDRKLKKMVWQGIAEGDLDDATYHDFTIHPAIRSIMKKFPVERTGM